jgi:hypothetical protein
LLAGNTAEARQVLDGLLADRIRFAPSVAEHQYRLTIPLAFDRVLVAVVPQWQGLQETVASPSRRAAFREFALSVGIDFFGALKVA